MTQAMWPFQEDVMNRRQWGAWGCATLFGPAAGAAQTCPALLQHRLPRLQDEKPVDLCGFAGRVLLVVNTASECGFTPQYQSLETLHQRFAARGLVVLGFPSNDFGSQEPANNKVIADFCQNQFDVRFPMFAKSVVLPREGSGPVNPLYAALAYKTGQRPGWNFHKYLVSRDARTVWSRPSETDPLDPGFVQEVERLLRERSY
jgi:glutathione peroxidase